MTMRNLVVVVQTSLDGFVAGADGGFDHFLGGEENLGFVCGITDHADAALFGRVSFQLLDSNWPGIAANPDATVNMIKYSNWYNAVPKYVLSKTLATENTRNVFVIPDQLETSIHAIKEQDGKDILIFGSPTAVQTLLDLQLIDRIWIIVHPVMFGEGIPLFRNRKQVIQLALIDSQQLSNGTLCNQYTVNK
jgi:dihydrofolate reductase